MIVLGFTGSQHWVPIRRLKQFLIRDGRGCGDKGEAVKKQYKKKETIEKPCGKALVPPQGINITILLSCFADTETQDGRN